VAGHRQALRTLVLAREQERLTERFDARVLEVQQGLQVALCLLLAQAQRGVRVDGVGWMVLGGWCWVDDGVGWMVSGGWCWVDGVGWMVLGGWCWV